MASQSFRAGVVMVIGTATGSDVLAFERVDIPGSWQLPQGGIEVGETPEEAAWRELAEETGLGPADVDLVAEHPLWTVYEWPPGVRKVRHRGQVQRWFRFVERNRGLQPAPDESVFSSWKWVDPQWLVAHVVDWRRPAYTQILLGEWR